jgi:hypothetical protein
MIATLSRGALIGAVAVGCAGPAATPPARASDEPAQSQAAAEEPASDEAAKAETTGGATAPVDEAADDSDAPPEEPGEANEGRRVLYRMTNEGLLIEVDGVELRPSVKPVQYKGGWAVEVRVKATATDERTHRLLSPENGPLMFAAKIEKNGKTETIGDERVGDDETFISPGDSTELTRRFPSGKLAPLWGGQTLTLYVGLWGLGADADRRRPVRKLFVLKMVTGSRKPQPVITPPE